MSTQPDLSAATTFIWRAARLIDRFRFAYLFLDGEREAVLAALRPYQNPDGGFGNALEPDLRAPLSQPVPVWSALEVLDEVDGGWFFNWREWNPTTTLEWRGWVTVEALKTLRAYGRLT